MQHSTTKLKRTIRKSETWDYDGDGRFPKLRIKGFYKKMKNRQLRHTKYKQVKDFSDEI